MDPTGVVNQEVTPEEVEKVLEGFDKETVKKVSPLVTKSRYINLQRLLGDYFDEKTYMDIVRNKILVDI